MRDGVGGNLVYGVGGRLRDAAITVYADRASQNETSQIKKFQSAPISPVIKGALLWKGLIPVQRWFHPGECGRLGEVIFGLWQLSGETHKSQRAEDPRVGSWLP